MAFLSSTPRCDIAEKMFKTDSSRYIGDSFFWQQRLLVQCFPFKTRRLPYVLVGPRVVSFANPLSAGSKAGNLSCPRVDYGLVLQPPLGLIPKTGGAQNVLNPAFGNQYLGFLVFQFLNKKAHTTKSLEVQDQLPLYNTDTLDDSSYKKCKQRIALQILQYFDILCRSKKTEFW